MKQGLLVVRSGRKKPDQQPYPPSPYLKGTFGADSDEVDKAKDILGLRKNI